MSDKNIRIIDEDDIAFGQTKLDYAEPNSIVDMDELFFWACRWHKKYHEAMNRTDPRDELIKKLVGASYGVLFHRCGDFPTSGRINDNNNSRRALQMLSQALAEAKQLGYGE